MNRFNPIVEGFLLLPQQHGKTKVIIVHMTLGTQKIDQMHFHIHLHFRTDMHQRAYLG